MKADHTLIERLLKTARGQINGVLNMIEEDQYCIDIVNQILASQAILNKASKEILIAHIDGCVSECFSSNDENFQKAKLEELKILIDKFSK